jgi:selenocysteine-specific elongation factor
MSCPEASLSTNTTEPGATSVILGTAGHIDHGKTALVKALTGIDTDRLLEERRRGITIELGFAHLALQGVQLGIVDVPGHERFIKSMVAGAGGIDLVMLVVAADEGVMPQTREHLDICELLRVQRGMVALTKSDLVEPDWLELVVDDLGTTLEGSFLEGAPVVPCSAVSGDGLERVRETLAELSRDVRPRDPDGLLRLPLDRVFTMKGFGTVVTGTLLSGTVSMGDDVAVLPTGVAGKVRGLQVHGQAVERAFAGQRTAVNLGGVDRSEVARGEVLVRPQTLSPSPMIDATVRLLPGTSRPLKARSKVLFHLGTRQQEASCILLQGPRLEPGQEGLAQLRFDRPLAALPGDRFILRGFRKQENYGTTVGGGEVVRVLSRKLRPRDAEAIALVERMAGAQDEQRVDLELLAAGPTGLTRAELQERLPMVPAALDRLLTRLMERRTVVRFDRQSGAVVHAEHFASMQRRLLQMVRTFHAERPLEEGIGREELRSRLPGGVSGKLHFALLSDLGKQGKLVLEQDLCRDPGHVVQKAARSIRPLADEIAGIYEAAGLGSPREAQVVERTGAAAAEVAAAIKLLVNEGRLMRVASLVFARRHVEQLQARLVEFLQREGQITAGQFKELVGQTRKYSIPLAEYFDAQKVTLRVGEIRKLRG